MYKGRLIVISTVKEALKRKLFVSFAGEEAELAVMQKMQGYVIISGHNDPWFSNKINCQKI